MWLPWNVVHANNRCFKKIEMSGIFQNKFMKWTRIELNFQVKNRISQKRERRDFLNGHIFSHSCCHRVVRSGAHSGTFLTYSKDDYWWYFFLPFLHFHKTYHYWYCIGNFNQIIDVIVLLRSQSSIQIFWWEAE